MHFHILTMRQICYYWDIIVIYWDIFIRYIIYLGICVFELIITMQFEINIPVFVKIYVVS